MGRLWRVSGLQPLKWPNRDIKFVSTIKGQPEED